MPQLEEWKDFAKALFEELNYTLGTGEVVEDILFPKMDNPYFSPIWNKLEERRALSRGDYRKLIGLIDELHHELQNKSYGSTEMRKTLLHSLKQGAERRVAVYRSLLESCPYISSITWRDDIVSLLEREQHYLDNWGEYPLDDLILLSNEGYWDVVKVLEKLERDKADFT